MKAIGVEEPYKLPRVSEAGPNHLFELGFMATFFAPGPLVLQCEAFRQARDAFLFSSFGTYDIRDRRGVRG